MSREEILKELDHIRIALVGAGASGAPADLARAAYLVGRLVGWLEADIKTPAA